MYKFNDLFLPMAIKFIEQENNRRLKANLQPLTIVFQCSFCSPLDPHIPFWGYYFRRISAHFKLDPGILVSRTPELPTLGTRYGYKSYNRVKNTHFYIATEDDITFCRQMRKLQEDHIIYRFQSESELDFMKLCYTHLRLYETRTFEYYEDLFKLINRDLCKKGN